VTRNERSALRSIGSANTKLGVAKRIAGNRLINAGRSGQAWPLAQVAGDAFCRLRDHADFYRLLNAILRSAFMGFRRCRGGRCMPALTGDRISR
jgi:hypothetical protein